METLTCADSDNSEEPRKDSVISFVVRASHAHSCVSVAEEARERTARYIPPYNALSRRQTVSHNVIQQHIWYSTIQANFKT